MKTWEIVVTISAIVATISTLLVNISKIQQQFGSIRDWIFNRAQLKIETERKAGESVRQMNTIAGTVDDLTNSVEKILQTLKASEETDKLLLRAKIIEMTDKISRRGYEYTYEVDDLNDLVERYHKLGGNGAVDSRMARIRAMQIRHLSEPWEWQEERKDEQK